MELNTTKIGGVPVIDLREYSAAELRNIECINNCTLLILPVSSDITDEWLDAYGNISLNNVADTLRLPMNVKVHTVNGEAELNDGNTVAGDFYLVNGIGYLNTRENKISVFANGISVITKSAALERYDINGLSVTIDDDADCMYRANKITLDADTMKYLKCGTAVAAGNKIIIDDSVTVEMLSEKNIKLIAGNKIVCNESVFGYVNATALAGNKIKKANKDYHGDVCIRI